MGSFEWMELQTLTGEITNSRSRLAAARNKKDMALAKVLEEEIASAEERRNQLLAHISTNLADDPDADSPGGAAEDSDRARALAAVEEAMRDSAANAAEPAGVASTPDDAPAFTDAQSPAADEPVSEEPPESPTATDAPAPASVSTAGSSEGGTIVWDQLTPSDLERAKSSLGTRRSEILARHAEELKELDEDLSQLEALEHAIGSFARKFNLAQPKAAVVQLDEERELRAQGSG